MKRKKLLLAGYTLAAFAAVGCAQKQQYEVFAANPIQSPPAVQQKVATAHKAELNGDTEKALALYREVLEADPNNDWSRTRVERLSGELPTLAAMKYERVTGRPAPSAENRGVNDAEIQRVAAEKARSQSRVPSTTPPTSPPEQSIASKKPTDRDLSDWLDEPSAIPRDAAAKPPRSTLANSATPSWAQGPAEKTTPATESNDDFEWARESAESKPSNIVAQKPTRRPTAAAASIDDESIFDALDRRENPFENLAAAPSSTKTPTAAQAETPASSPVSTKPVAEDRFAWADSRDAGAETKSTPSPSPIKRVAFAPSESSMSQGTPLVELCRDANLHVLGMVEKLESPLATVRREGLNEIGLLGKKANTARLPVRILCDDPVPVVAAEAAWTLWQIDQDSFQSVRRLTKLIDAKDPEAAGIAIQSLGLIGADAIAAAPVLRSRLASAAGVRRVRIAEALIRIQPEDTGALQALVEATRYGRTGERVDATYALAHTPAVHLDAIAPVLVNALHDKDESVRTAAALTLGSFGQSAEQARLALEAAARFDTRPVRDAARATLACLPGA